MDYKITLEDVRNKFIAKASCVKDGKPRCATVWV